MKKVTALLLTVIYTAISSPPYTDTVMAADKISFIVDCSTIISPGDSKRIDNVETWTGADGNEYLFLPNSAVSANPAVYYSGTQKIRINNTEINNGDAVSNLLSGDSINITDNDGKTHTVRILRSSEVSTLFIKTQSGNLDKIHNSKNYKEPGNMLLVDTNNTAVYNNSIAHIKGRGNATWSYEKKPYTIKLDTSTNLLGMGKSKGWVLIANYIDKSHLNNRIAFAWADDMGIEFTSNMEPVNLYINNKYHGLYYLTEKLDVSDSHVDIRDLEEATQLANATDDLSVYPRLGTGIYSTDTSKYFNIPNNPADITGGYLLELELNIRYDPELSGFVTKNHQAVVIKSPEHASENQAEYIKNLYSQMEEAVYSETGYNTLGKHYSEYIDVESFAKMYLVQEGALNLDAAITSFFIYKDSDLLGDGKFHAAPIWDFDNSFGIFNVRDGYNLSKPTTMWVCNGNIYNDNNGTPHLFNAMTNHDDFMVSVINLWRETAAPALINLFQSDVRQPGVKINTFSEYVDELTASAAMDSTRWNGADFSVEVNKRINFISSRIVYLNSLWGESGYPEYTLPPTSAPTSFSPVNTTIPDSTAAPGTSQPSPETETTASGSITNGLPNSTLPLNPPIPTPTPSPTPTLPSVQNITSPSHLPSTHTPETPTKKILTLIKKTPKKVTVKTKKIKIKTTKGAKVKLTASGLRAKSKLTSIAKKTFHTFNKLNFKKVLKGNIIKIKATKPGHISKTLKFKRR